MRKLLIPTIIILLTSIGSATTLTNEDIKIDLNTNTVNTEIQVDELTSSTFPYVSNNDIENLNASINGETVECNIQESAIGSEIRCPTELKQNFTVKLEYQINNLISTRDNTKIFQYEHSIYRPTDDFSLRVTLPDGNAILKEKNTTQQVISPLDYSTDSNGRQILVDWNTKPQLGNTLSFYILMEEIQGPGQNLTPQDTIPILASITIILLALAGSIFIYKREDLSETMNKLNEDQKEIIERIRENNGTYLQKDLVDEMDYSKAKISGEVSKLVEKDILNKTKKGRSNKLVISRKYRY